MLVVVDVDRGEPHGHPVGIDAADLTLDVDELIAQLLVTEGFSSVEDIAYVGDSELASIEGFDDDVAAELGQRARDFVDRVNAELTEQRRALGVTDEVAAFEAFEPRILVILGKAGVKTLDDVGDLASDELRELLPDAGLSEDEANDIIMAARAHWFEDEETPADVGESGASSDASEDSNADKAGAPTDDGTA